MKIICDCGNEIELEKIEEDIKYESYERYQSWNIEAFSDYVFINCTKCEKKYRIE